MITMPPTPITTPLPTITTSLFEGLWDRLAATLAPAGFESQPVQPPFDQRQGKAGLSLESQMLTHPRGSVVKSCQLRSPKVQIINIMGYPRNPALVPVFALEFVALANLVRVAVVDLQPVNPTNRPLRTRVEQAAAPLHRHWAAHLPAGGSLPDWATDHFTPVCLYTRPDSNAVCPTLLDAAEAWAVCWRDHFLADEARHPSPTEFAEAELDLSAYKHHHITHTPGRPFLRSTLGESWAEAYLRQFMYA